ncbi:hypothetical protein L1987_01788 [Smallanthus sonchifolius]|uniref:Uncharacterized protein n=1 Tax=Smallanthus sonchifolius TaxID=185202 RepID=A0ACB9K686_9ASTR|nr:hypothetical protein L1987_01788 [Smallanthus sonchifolius]
MSLLLVLHDKELTKLIQLQDWCAPSTVLEIVTSPDDSGAEGQASDNGGRQQGVEDSGELSKEGRRLRSEAF